MGRQCVKKEREKEKKGVNQSQTLLEVALGKNKTKKRVHMQRGREKKKDAAAAQEAWVSLYVFFSPLAKTKRNSICPNRNILTVACFLSHSTVIPCSQKSHDLSAPITFCAFTVTLILTSF